MKFLFTKDIRHNMVIRTLLVCYLLSLILYSLGGFFVETFHFGFWPESVEHTIAGHPEAFQKPMDLRELVLDVHVRLFVTMVSLLTIFSFVYRMGLAPGLQLTLIASSFLVALIDGLSPFGVRFFHTGFSYVKTASFVLLQLDILSLSILGIIFLLRRPGGARP